MRTLINIPEEDIRSLDELAGRAKRSRAAEVREAVRRHIKAEKNNAWIWEGAGYWKDRTDIGDAVEYQRSIREDRTRDW